MILGRLFEALFEQKVVLASPPTARPTQLYKNGINRQLFVPFIDMIEERCEVVELAGAARLAPRPADRGPRSGSRRPTTPSRAAFETLWADLQGRRARDARRI